MIIEQTSAYQKRMRYDPVAQTFSPTDYDSLMYARNFPYPYGWLKDTGTPPGEHLDIILLSRRIFALGDAVAVRIVGVFIRSDGDHKIIAIERDRPEMDFESLPTCEKEALHSLYPRVGPGEGWYGRECALDIYRAFPRP